MKKIFFGVLLVSTIYACSNKNAEYNTAVYQQHSIFQNNLSDLSEKLSADSITNDSARHFIATTKTVCDTIYAAFKKIKAPGKAASFNEAMDLLLQQQLSGLVIRKKLYDDTEPGEAFSLLQDSLDISDAKVDSLNIKVKALQVEFAKACKFKLN